MELNNNIQESYCSFPVSKLLKEKGFDQEDCQPIYMYPDGTPIGEEIFEKKDKFPVSTWIEFKKPTHTLAVEWIRVNFGIYISISIMGDIDMPSNTIKSKSYGWILSDMKLDETSVGAQHFEKHFNSPHAATEAALEYVLTNLI